jgi:hypothetical protein
MADPLSLIFRIQADSSGATQAMQSVQESLNKVTTSTVSLGAASKSAGSQITDALNNSLLNVARRGGPLASDAIVQVSSAFGGMTTAAGGSVLALGAAVIGLVSLAKEAADAGSELHDLSQITNISANALAGLGVAAVKGGGSLEQLANAFVRLQRQAVEANEETLEAMGRLGIDAEQVTTDLEGAIDSFLKRFNELGPSAQRNADLIAVFGRAGARMIPVFSEAEGGLKDLIEQADKLGTTMGHDAVQAADRLGDSIDLLSTQLKGITIQIGIEFMPLLQGLIDGLAKIRVLLPGIQLASKGIAFILSEIAQLLIPLGGVLKIAEFLGRQLVAISGIDAKIKLDIPDTILKPATAKQLEELANLARTGRRDGKVFPQKPEAAKAGEKDITALELRLNDLERLAEEAKRIRDEDLDVAQRQATEIPAAMSDAHAKSIAAEEAYLQKMLSLLGEQRKIIEATVLLPNKRKDALANLAAEEGKIIDESNKRIQDLLTRNQKVADDLSASNVKIAQSSRDLMSEQTKLAAERLAQIKTEHDALMALQFTEEEIIAARASSHTAAVKQAKTQAKEAKSALEQRQREQEADTTTPASIFGIFDPEGDATAIEGVLGALQGGLEDTAKSFGSFRDIAAGAFQAVAGAAQQVLSAFILTGKAGGAAFKKLTADIIAALVVQSAVKAIFELAEGFAALFLNPPAAAAHFAAAKLYGAVAAGAGIVAAGIGAAGGLGGGGGGEGQFGGAPPAARPGETRLGVLSPFDQLAQSVQGLNENVGVLAGKISSMRPADVVTIGAPGASSAIGQAVGQELRRDADLTNQIGRSILGPV